MTMDLDFPIPLDIFVFSSKLKNQKIQRTIYLHFKKKIQGLKHFVHLCI